MSRGAAPETSGARVPRSAATLLVFALLLALAPAFDVAFGALFWNPREGFFLADLWPVRALYRGTRWVMASLAIGLLIALLAAHLPRFQRLRRHRARLWFAAAALAIGPGLIANTVLKDHWGRPRPAQIADFGGRGNYVPPWRPGDQCDHNCAFVSAHAAAGYFVITGAWLWPRARRRWLLGGIALGSLVGLGRIAQGGHFASDVIGALAVVWLSNAVLHRWMKSRGWLPAQ